MEQVDGQYRTSIKPNTVFGGVAEGALVSSAGSSRQGSTHCAAAPSPDEYVIASSTDLDIEWLILPG